MAKAIVGQGTRFHLVTYVQPTNCPIAKLLITVLRRQDLLESSLVPLLIK